MPRFIYDIIPSGLKQGVVTTTQEVSKWLKFLKIFLKTSKYGAPLLVIILVGFGALLVFAFYPKTEIVEIFPAQYSVETELNWRNGEKALQRDLDKEASLAEFSSENSAILFAGEEVRVTEEITTESENLIERENLIEEEVSSESIDEEIDEEMATESEGFEKELIEEVGVATTESEEIIEEEVEVIATESEEIEEIIGGSEEIPEGVGGCEFCDEEELASDAEDLSNLLEEIEEVPSISQPPLIKQSIIFSDFDFNSSISFDSFKKAKLAFSFAAEEGNQEDVLLVEYRIPESASVLLSVIEENLIDNEIATESESIIEETQSDSITIEDLIDEEISTSSEPETDETEGNLEDLSEWKTLKLIKLDKQQSNFINNGYWQKEILDIASWEDLANLEVRFTFQGIDSENRLLVYLDAVWLSIEYSKPEREEERENLEEEYELELLSDKLNFRIDEDLEFKFHFRKKQKKNILGLIFAGKNRDTDIKIEFLGRDAELLNKINPQIQHQENGKFTVSLNGLNLYKLRPGKYKIRIRIENTEGIFISEQEFTWGVLAINTNKSIYLPNEQAYLQMAALKDDGHTICDANLKLEITPPSGEQFSAAVQISGKCGPNNVTDVPDYFAYYQVEGAGVYQMKLTNLDNDYEITDSFEVRNFVPFDIERIGPTRIYPPADYEMTLRIKVNQDFSGEVREYVPESFKVLDPIIWQVDWKQGETYELKYQFDAPNISPYLYLLGPLEIGEFKEARQWQIASDQTVYDYSGGSSVNWIDEANAWNSSDGNYASRDIPAGTGDSGNYLLGSTVSAPGSGTITTVEIGIESYVEGTQITAHLIPVFGGETDGAGTYTIIGDLLGLEGADATNYKDITNDGNAPSWQWSDVEALDVRIYADDSHPNQSRFFYIDQIMVRVTVEAANQPPTINEVSLNSKVTPIILIENTQIDIMVSASVTDTDGCSDISGVKAIVYRYDLYSDASCSLNYNNCYDEDQFECVADGACVSNTQPYNCYASSSMWYFADPTTANASSSYADDQWVVSVIASDSVWQDTVSHSWGDNDDVVDIEVLTALDVSTSITFGEVLVNQNTGSSPDEIGIKNTGNWGIDTEISGTTKPIYNGNEIDYPYQKYASMSIGYSDEYNKALSDTAAAYNVTILKPTNNNAGANDVQIFWGIGIPVGTPVGTYNGVNTFSVTSDGTD